MKIRNLLLVFVCCTLFACKNEPKKAENDGSPTAMPNPSTAQKPEVWLYMAMVDKLNLREQPNKNGKVLTQLSEGMVVENDGTVSENKEDATLRGLSYTEPYVQVMSLVPGAPKTWAYRGGLLHLYAGSQKDKPDANALQAFAAYLKTLNIRDLESGKKAWTYVSARLSDAKGPLADAVYFILEDFINRLDREGRFYELTEKQKWSDEDYQTVTDGKFDMKRNALTQSLAEAGFCLVAAEGTIFPTPDYARYSAFFADKTTPGTSTYLKQEHIEYSKPAWEDGGIIISMDLLADRAVFWEKFNRDYPYFPQHFRTQEHERWMANNFISGSDNSPVCDYEKGEVLPELRQAWAYILQKYPNTQLGQYVKEINDLCIAENWKCSEKVKDFQAQFVKRIGL